MINNDEVDLLESDSHRVNRRPCVLKIEHPLLDSQD